MNASPNAPVSAPAPIMLQVPVHVPDLAAIVREAALEAAREINRWLSLDEAAAYLGVCPKTFWRKKKLLGLPVVELDGVKRILRADLDAALLAHLKAPANPIVQFPSVEMRTALLEKTPVAA